MTDYEGEGGQTSTIVCTMHHVMSSFMVPEVVGVGVGWIN